MGLYSPEKKYIYKFYIFQLNPFWSVDQFLGKDKNSVIIQSYLFILTVTDEETKNMIMRTRRKTNIQSFSEVVCLFFVCFSEVVLCLIKRRKSKKLQGRAVQIYQIEKAMSTRNIWRLRFFLLGFQHRCLCIERLSWFPC